MEEDQVHEEVVQVEGEGDDADEVHVRNLGALRQGHLCDGVDGVHESQADPLVERVLEGRGLFPLEREETQLYQSENGGAEGGRVDQDDGEVDVLHGPSEHDHYGVVEGANQRYGHADCILWS